MLIVKYLFPRYLRNTHSKIVAFLFIINALNLYKTPKKQWTNPEFAHYLILALSVAQSFLHGFKLSSFSRSNILHPINIKIDSSNQVVERVVNEHDAANGSNIDRIF